MFIDVCEDNVPTPFSEEIFETSIMFSFCPVLFFFLFLAKSFRETEGWGVNERGGMSVVCGEKKGHYVFKRQKLDPVFPTCLTVTQIQDKGASSVCTKTANMNCDTVQPHPNK